MCLFIRFVLAYFAVKRAYFSVDTVKACLFWDMGPRIKKVTDFFEKGTSTDRQGPGRQQKKTHKIRNKQAKNGQ